MSNTPSNSTYQKALAFNMDNDIYGTIAEIGAGQEIARWFFKVGGAAGTIAKALSAYDMKFSDSIYGPCKRYVSRERLHAMLDVEYDLLIQRLTNNHDSDRCFFAFANTVATHSYTTKRAGHGWLGVRFQARPHEPASQIDLHVVLNGRESTQDQDAIGVLGVNLISGARQLHKEPRELLKSLLDDLSTEQLEIDMVDFQGPAFADVDNRLMALRLVRYGMTPATIFRAGGKLIQPADALYKKAILVERSRFRPPTNLNMDMLECAYRAFSKEPDVNKDNVIVLSEMTLHSLVEGDDIDTDDFLQRVEILCALGKNVMISKYVEFYRLSQYLHKYTSLPVAIVMGVPTLLQLFDETYYENLEGGILESFGRMFKNETHLFVSPALDESNGELITVSNLKVQPHLCHLYQYLLENGCIKELDTINKDLLSIYSHIVLEKIRTGDAEWETMVPDEVVRLIRERGLFDYTTP